ncbi:MAG: SRPBCC family protein [Bacteroidota bacterium]
MLTLKKSFSIAASKEKVWHALTEPEQIKRYFFGTDTVTDWQVGSPVFFRGVWDGKAYEDKGTVLEHVPFTKLKYNYWSSFSTKPDLPENYANISYLLEEKDGQTIFTVVQDGIDTEELLKHSEGNWTMVINGLKELVENQ